MFGCNGAQFRDPSPWLTVLTALRKIIALMLLPFVIAGGALVGSFMIAGLPLLGLSLIFSADRERQLHRYPRRVKYAVLVALSVPTVLLISALLPVWMPMALVGCFGRQARRKVRRFFRICR